MMRLLRVAALLWLSFAPAPARAIIVLGDPGQIYTVNTPSPFNLDSYYGTLDTATLAVPISPTFFVTVTHAGNSAQTFTYNNGTSTPTVYQVQQFATLGDLALWQIMPNSGTFSYYAPVYTNPNIVGQPLVTIGNGQGRSSTVVSGPFGAQGWLRSNLGGLSWGTGTVDAVLDLTSTGNPGNYLYFQFSNNPNNPNNASQAIYGGGDSGGPTFVFDSATQLWELAGLNSLVDGGLFQKNPDGSFSAINAVLYDARGFYIQDSNGQFILITGNSPVPMGSYAVDIQSDIDWLISEGVPIGVPEPSSLVLTGLVAAGFALRYWRRSAPAVPSLPQGQSSLTPSASIASARN